jgi:hypothetical protein
MLHAKAEGDGNPRDSGERFHKRQTPFESPRLADVSVYLSKPLHAARDCALLYTSTDPHR